MLNFELLILLTGVLLVLGIASNKFSARLGVPVLFVFIMVGMLAGSEGIGGIEFENYALANGIGTIALCMILFDGGLRTPYRSVRAAWKPALSLATFGVLITAAITGLATAWIFDLPLLEGLLLGAIVGSTDASAVFSVLRSGGVHIRRRISDTLEVESGSNDPMAIFLTIGLIQILTGETTPGAGLLSLFFQQFLLGAGAGILIGFSGVWALKHIKLGAAGLYPVLATALALLSFGLAALFGGSGFLAVYLTGMIIGNARPIFHRGILLFHDAGAWICQILMFMTLGLLSFPSRLFEAAGSAILVAAVLILIARPIAVFLCASWFGFSRKELLFLSWVGLKGAVPITLATFPMLARIPEAPLIFDTVFFVVLISALMQGWTLPTVARRLGLDEIVRRPPPVTLEISSLQNIDGDIVDYFVDPDCIAAEKMLSQLALPEGVVVALIVRNEEIIPPHGRSRLEKEDHVIVVMRPALRPLVDRLFVHRELSNELTSAPQGSNPQEFPLRGSIRMTDFQECYSLGIGYDPATTVDAFLRHHLAKQRAQVGDIISLECFLFRVREVNREGEIEKVGMTILPESEWQKADTDSPSAPTTAGADGLSQGKPKPEATDPSCE